MALQWSMRRGQTTAAAAASSAAHLFFFSALVFFRSKIQFDFQVVFYKVGYAVGAIKRCHYYGPAGKNESLGVLLLSPAASLALKDRLCIFFFLS